MNSTANFLGLDRPDDAIPVDEWLALRQSQRDFIQFIYDIQKHFETVVTEKMQWQPKNVLINQGVNSVVIAFTNQHEQKFVFRVPKYGMWQLQTIMRIRSILQEKAYFPEIVYYDSQCLVERFIEGHVFDEQTSIIAYESLAHVLADLHQTPGHQFGPLAYGTVGLTENAQDFYNNHQDMQTAWRYLLDEDFFPRQDVEMLQQHWQNVLENMSAPTVLCHGDLWFNNIFYHAESNKVTLIDWDASGVYHCEKDLHFLVNESVSEAQLNRFLAHYPHPVDPVLLHWYRFTKHLKYWHPDCIKQFVNAANGFLAIRGENRRLQWPCCPSE